MCVRPLLQPRPEAESAMQHGCHHSLEPGREPDLAAPRTAHSERPRAKSRGAAAGAIGKAYLIRCSGPGLIRGGELAEVGSASRLERSVPERSGDLPTYIISRTAWQGVSRSKLVGKLGVVLTIGGCGWPISQGAGPLWYDASQGSPVSRS
jgi:hypothetical protein